MARTSDAPALSGATVVAAVLFAAAGLAGTLLGRADLVALWLLGYLVAVPAVELLAGAIQATLTGDR